MDRRRVLENPNIEKTPQIKEAQLVPRVANITVDRRFVQPRWDENAPLAPDLARSESDFFRGLFDPPLKKEVARDVVDTRARRPSTAMGFVRARAGGMDKEACRSPLRRQQDGGWEGDMWRQENVERSRQSFGKLALDAPHTASMWEFLESELPLSTSQLQQRAGTPAKASQALNRSETRNAERGTENISAHNSVCEQSVCARRRYTGAAVAVRQRPATGGLQQRKLHASAQETFDRSKSRDGRGDGGEGKLGAEEYGAGGLGLEKSVESEDSNILHVIMHPVRPSVRVGIPRSANGNSRQYSQLTSNTPPRRCKSATGKRLKTPPYTPSHTVAHVYDKNSENLSFSAGSGALPDPSILEFFSMRQMT